MKNTFEDFIYDVSTQEALRVEFIGIMNDENLTAEKLNEFFKGRYLVEPGLIGKLVAAAHANANARPFQSGNLGLAPTLKY